MMAAPAAVKADDADPVQLDGENNYTDDNGIVYNFVISGSSATLGMIDLSGADAYDVVVPGAVTKGDVTASVSQIKNGIFCKKTEITSIDISATKVTTFQTKGPGRTAFEGCSGMVSIKLPETLTQLPNYMFDGCSSLEMVEIPEHPWFLAVQFHPEFKSRPNHAHPLFRSFIGAALKKKKSL